MKSAAYWRCVRAYKDFLRRPAESSPLALGRQLAELWWAIEAVPEHEVHARDRVLNRLARWREERPTPPFEPGAPPAP